MIFCTRKLRFCAGHRVLGHEGKCSSPHGHNYEVHITASASTLDSIGRVIDFSVLKEKVGGWIDHNWDHAFLVFSKDHALIEALRNVPDGKPPFVTSFNPTAENIAHHLLHTVCPEQLSGLGIQVIRVVVHETSNCYAEATLSE